MKSYHEQFKDRIDMTDGTVVLREEEYKRIVQLAGGISLSPAQAAEALKEAMDIIQKVGTTGIEHEHRHADEWMKRYFPNWA